MWPEKWGWGTIPGASPGVERPYAVRGIVGVYGALLGAQMVSRVIEVSKDRMSRAMAQAA